MKTQLTAEQSAKLIELGVSPERASKIKVEVKESSRGCPNIYCSEVKRPIFTLADILDILPKENVGSNLGMEYDCEFKQWWVGYNLRHLESAPELIDALYSLLVWCLEKGYVK